MQLEQMFFSDWHRLAGTMVVSALAFTVLVILLRFLGKKMLLTSSASSFAMTVALGNALATAALDGEIDITETTVGFLALMLLQWLLFKLTAHFGWLEDLTRSKAAVVFRDGEILADALRREHVAEEDVYAAIRRSGAPELHDVGAVVFESNGALTVIPRTDDGHYSVIEDALVQAR